MILKVDPVSSLCGTVDLPASKSYSIRAFFVAACGGKSVILAPSDCDDAKAAMTVVSVLGIKVKKVSGGFSVDASRCDRRKEHLKINVKESGTSLRFVLPLLPFYVRSAVVRGEGTLVGRPNLHLIDALRRVGIDMKGTGSGESVPVVYRKGEIGGGRIVIDGSVSSQFISALMIACPRASENTRLIMRGKTLVSRDYVVMTRQILSRSGVSLVFRSAREIFIPGGQRFKGLRKFHVPSDYGLAAFFMAAAALLKSDVVLKGRLDDTLIQSDGAIVGLLKKMGLRMFRTTGAMRIKGPFVLEGGTFSLKDCPDLVPIMTVAAMFAKGPTRLKDIGHTRVKESDRISDLRKELLKVGADIREKRDELIIHPRPVYKSGILLDPHHDHRLAMAFAVLGLKVGATVRDVECTSKSWPGFVRALKRLV